MWRTWMRWPTPTTGPRRSWCSASSRRIGTSGPCSYRGAPEGAGVDHIQVQEPRDQAGEHSQAWPPDHQKRSAPHSGRKDREGVLDGRRDEGGGLGGRGELQSAAGGDGQARHWEQGQCWRMDDNKEYRLMASFRDSGSCLTYRRKVTHHINYSQKIVLYVNYYEQNSVTCSVIKRSSSRVFKRSSSSLQDQY